MSNAVEELADCRFSDLCERLGRFATERSCLRQLRWLLPNDLSLSDYPIPQSKKAMRKRVAVI